MGHGTWQMMCEYSMHIHNTEYRHRSKFHAWKQKKLQHSTFYFLHYSPTPSETFPHKKTSRARLPFPGIKFCTVQMVSV